MSRNFLPRTRAHALLSALFALATCTACADTSKVSSKPSSDAGAPPACAAPDFATDVPLPGLTDGVTDDGCVWSALFDAVSGARVVCSGEGSHGIAESTPAHLVVARELLIHRGYRTLALELDDASAARISAFVNDGDEAALATYFADLDHTLAATVALEDFFRALREIRQELPADAKVSVRGLDVAIAPGPTRDRLFAYLHRVDEVTASAYDARIPRVVTRSSAADEAATAAAELRQVIESKKAEYSSQDVDGYELAVLDARMLEEGFRFNTFYLTGDFTTGNATLRDPAMARNLLDFAARGSVMVIAHEAHCAHDTPSDGTKRSAGTFSFGKAVSQQLGAGYVVLGQIFSAGKELFPDGTTHDIYSLPGSLQRTIASSTELSSLLIRTATYQPMDLGKDWPLDRFDEKTSPAKQLDALVWTRAVSPTRFH